MSLNVYLYLPPGPNAPPETCFHCDQPIPPREREVYSANITHNLANMASEAGIYDALWRPDENGMVYARDIIDVLMAGCQRMLDAPEHYKTFNAPNGWGLYENFLPWVGRYINACHEYPDARIRVSR